MKKKISEIADCEKCKHTRNYQGTFICNCSCHLAVYVNDYNENKDKAHWRTLYRKMNQVER